jgi:hypothetical protein
MFPTNPEPVRWLTRTEPYGQPQKARVLPDTPVLLVQYALKLAEQEVVRELPDPERGLKPHWRY